MKYLKMFGLAAFAAMAFTAFVGAGTASATTLETTGVTQNESVSIIATIKAGDTAILRDTFGFSANTCTGSTVEGTTNVTTGATVTGPVATLAFTNCEHPVTVTNPGTLHVEHLAGTTNGRVRSSGAEVTTYSTIHGTYIHCETGAGVSIGTLTGVKHGHATMDINATLTCGPHLHSAKWTGTYTITSPTDLGVSA